jgi:hypothetical protein
MADQDKEKEAEARREGRDQAEGGSDKPSHGWGDSEPEKDARESGFNEQRTADAADNDDED